MSTDPPDRVYADLVGGLLDSRDDPATERFDAELERAVQRGEASPELARRLRYWQRASLRSLTDHTRTVLPAVLGALAASGRETRRDVEELSATLEHSLPAPAEPTAAPPAEPAQPPHPAEPEQPPEPEPRPGEPVVDLRDTPERASTPPTSGPSSLGERHRMIVAGLVTAPTTLRPERY